MNAFVFAAGLDWLEALLPFLFVLFWIVSQVVSVFRNVAGRGKPQRPAPPRPVAERVDDVRADLERQIGEFLDKKAQRQVEPSPRPQPVRGRQEKSKPLAARPAGGIAAAEPRPGQPAAPSRLGSLGDHGGDVARHVQDAFADDLEHQRSRRARPANAEGPAAARPAPATHELVRLLRDPDSLRRLFLVREVLDRPIQRWE